MNKKIFFILFIFLIAGRVFADTATPGEGEFSYSFHLFYDKGQLYADRDFQFKYDILAQGYEQPPVNTQFPYRGEIINFAGEVADHFTFDPKQGDVKFVSGKISVEAPYVADAQKVNFYNAQNQPLISIYVSESSFCNDDGVCNDDRGEDPGTCPKDCKLVNPTAPQPVNPGDNEATTNLIWSAVYVGIGIILIAGLWIWRRKKKTPPGSMKLPPIPPRPPYPSSSLPTPPPPPKLNNPV
ncbi:hypothetical protein KW791_01280 [Candidatus Parcubacteria bacterium]|nr:hypothetical protein [Candidatus Parcubacteria bacterium]